ncbi:MAG: VOC family protein [Pseudomonadota bacterium]
MAIVGLDHVQLAIPEGGEGEARAFFVDLLGMREVPKPPNLSAQGCWFESQGVSLHLGVDPDFTPARKAHPAFLVDSATRVRAQLEAAGIATKDEAPVEGYERFFAHDPFGNRIEFMEQLGASSAAS